MEFRDLAKFAFPSGNEAPVWSQPFPTSVSPFPVPFPANTSTRHKETIQRDDNIPKHLPAYPPAHTYNRSYNSKKRSAPTSASISTEENAKRRLKRIENLKNIQKSFSSLDAAETNETKADVSSTNIAGPPLLEPEFKLVVDSGSAAGGVTVVKSQGAMQTINVDHNSQFAKSLTLKDKVLLGLMPTEES